MASGQGVPISSTQLRPTNIGMRPMCSTPEPITTSWTPVAISAAPKLTACCAEPHWRSIVVAGVSQGSPACSQALRPMLNDCSPYCWTQPARTSSINSGSMPASDGRPHRLDDDDFATLHLDLRLLAPATDAQRADGCFGRAYQSAV